MMRKNKALAVAVVGLFLSTAPIGCASQLGGKSKQQVVKADDGGEEEVLSVDEDPDRDEFGRPKDDTTGGFFVSAAYLGMSLAGSLLPLLLLL